MINVGIMGASGYTGQELTRILVKHPKVQKLYLFSDHLKSVDIFNDKKINIFSRDAYKDFIEEIDIFFFALENGEAAKFLSEMKIPETFIDLSADFRFQNPEVYERVYGIKHPIPELIGKTEYGLPEVFRERIKKAKFIANPGCYPTASILGLYPLVKNNLILASAIIDAKSGISGSGRKASDKNIYGNIAENFQAYSILNHRHQPEIEQILKEIGYLRVLFIPQLLPTFRGIFASIYAPLRDSISSEDLFELYKETYKGEYFIKILPPGYSPEIKKVRGSNFVMISAQVDKNTENAVVFVAIDNLIKGAAGQAVQNMNLIFGFSEEEGIDFLPLYP
ncbi:MAG: N-acetyl-gamma-glutamyl-phosphate reductase [Dictyoglomaceae bacterium]|nr:N-acetyl-gamma-glutamyl-phosphate reductase [Dictyoglomaceae bacterium]HOP94972.1 N-acetyl-gamma-glutamyl-phosphate reductase [Dictyoglomaceae bacterium]HPP16477.1 N-acetyl-gamma-glutamyl-phosphate reductase [Dictyoglomaceae bacterium]